MKGLEKCLEEIMKRGDGASSSLLYLGCIGDIGDRRSKQTRCLTPFSALKYFTLLYHFKILQAILQPCGLAGRHAWPFFFFSFLFLRRCLCLGAKCRSLHSMTFSRARRKADSALNSVIRDSDGI